MQGVSGGEGVYGLVTCRELREWRVSRFGILVSGDFGLLREWRVSRFRILVSGDFGLLREWRVSRFRILVSGDFGLPCKKPQLEKSYKASNTT